MSADSLYQSLLPVLSHFQQGAYWLAFLVALAETVLVLGMLMPGTTILLLMGAWASTGSVSFTGVFVFGVAGAVLGDNVNYWLGRRYGQRWLESGVWFLKPDHIARAHEFLDRNGAKSIFLGRFIPTVKEVAPFIAGSVGMNRRAFMFWNLLGAIGWGIQWIGGGYLFGQSVALAQAWMSRLGLVFLVLLLLWITGWYFKRWLIRQAPLAWGLIRSLGRSVQQSFRQNLYIRRFMRRHPRLIALVRARLDPRHFSGRPATMLALAMLYILLLFAGVVEDLFTSDPIVLVDEHIAQLVAHFRPPEIIPYLLGITALGDGFTITLIGTGVALILWMIGQRWTVLALVVSVGGASAFTWLTKLVFHRPRPADALLNESSYAFPSGHATAAMAMYGFLGYYIMRHMASLRRQANVLLATMFLVLLIGASRILLGVHYLSDVWAGYLIGAGWLVVGIAINEWAMRTGKVETLPHERDSRRRSMQWGVATAMTVLITIHVVTWRPVIRTLPVPDLVEVTTSVITALKTHGAIHTENLLGAPSQPLSLVFLADSDEVMTHALAHAGWRLASPPDLANLYRLLRDGMNDETPPLTPAFWRGRINDQAWVHPAQVDGKTVLDTLRIWKTDWQFMGSRVYVAVSRTYTGMYLGLWHTVSPDTDSPATRLVEALRGSEQSPVPGLCQVRVTEPEIGTYLLQMQYYASGSLWLVDFRGRDCHILTAG